MQIDRIISMHADRPLPHGLVASWLRWRKNADVEIGRLKAQGILEPLKEGLYLAGPKITDKKPDTLLVANHLLGPSYLSVETALSYYGLIPKSTSTISSMTTNRARTYNTTLGLYKFTRLPAPYYSFGLKTTDLSTDQYIIMASPEKALCDKIVTESAAGLAEYSDMHSYLVQGLGIQESALKEMNVEMIRKWIPEAPQKKRLLALVEVLEAAGHLKTSHLKLHT